MNFQGHSDDDTAVCVIKFSEKEELTRAKQGEKKGWTTDKVLAVIRF